LEKKESASQHYASRNQDEPLARVEVQTQFTHACTCRLAGNGVFRWQVLNMGGWGAWVEGGLTQSSGAAEGLVEFKR
jgi:hypothetical protein